MHSKSEDVRLDIVVQKYGLHRHPLALRQAFGELKTREGIVAFSMEIGYDGNLYAHSQNASYVIPARVIFDAIARSEGAAGVIVDNVRGGVHVTDLTKGEE